MFTNTRVWRIVGPLALGLPLLGPVSNSQACEPVAPYAARVYQWVRVPHRVCVTRYDEYGYPRHVYVTHYRSVRIQVRGTIGIGW